MVLDAYYGRKANNKKADEGMITFSEAFWRGGIKDDMRKKSQLEIQSMPFRRLVSVMRKLVHIMCVEDEIWFSNMRHVLGYDLPSRLLCSKTRVVVPYFR
jgi:hypothetical protein